MLKDVPLGSAALLAVTVVLFGCGSPRTGASGSDTVDGGAPAGTGGSADLDGSGGSFNPGTGGRPTGSGGVGPIMASMDAGSTRADAGADAATPSATSGSTYYVSPQGSDDNAGTESKPLRTITKARDVVRTANANMADDIHVLLRGGRYDIRSAIAFGPRDSGTNGHTIFYEAYPGETPVLNGATQVTGWTPHGEGILKASLNRSTKLRNLYVNDARAEMASKTVTSKGGYGTYTVTAGQADWAWTSGSNSDGVKYAASEVPAIANDKDDLEIVGATTWNENIVCVRDVITTPENDRALLLQQPYGAIAQLPANAAFNVSGKHTICNALELLSSPGQFYFDKTAQTLYYYPRTNEDMSTADVEAPVAERLIDIAGTSNDDRVHGLTFKGLTFANTDYSLFSVGGSCGKATSQGATGFIAYGDGNFHNGKYAIIDTLPAMINVSNAESIEFVGNVVEHSGNEGISMVNDVIHSSIVGNSIRDIAGSGITVGHPQHVYLGDGGDHAKYPPGVEGVCTDDSIANNLVYEASLVHGFGGHAGITAFFVDTLAITHNQIQRTAYNGINLGWGWRNFPDSTTCRNNSIDHNRFIDTMSRLHDSGAVYTLGQMPGTNINENYVRGIPPAASGPTYGLHNDEGSAYITENDNVLDIDPGVKYTINCEDFGAKHDLTILRTYATVNKMGADPPNSSIDAPVAVPDNVWPLQQYETCVQSGIEDAYRDVLPSGITSISDYVFPASASVSSGSVSIDIRSAGDKSKSAWFAPPGTTQFAESSKMTRAAGDATSITVPAQAGTYTLSVVDAQGNKLDESAAQLRVQ